MAYEFTEEENKIFNDLSESLRQFTVPLLIFAVLEVSLAGVIYYSYHPAESTLLYTFSLGLGIVAFFFAYLSGKIRAGFHMIIGTEGSDINHLMEVMLKLKKSLFMGASVACLFSLLLLATIMKTLMSILG